MPAKKRVRQTSSPVDPNGFYETMPLTAMPHSIYRDDQDEIIDYNYAQDDESSRAARSIMALVTLAMVVLVAVAFVGLVLYGLASITNTVAPGNITAGSL